MMLSITRSYNSGDRWTNKYGAMTGETILLREKPVQAPPRLPQIPHQLAWDRTCGDRPETNWKEIVLKFKTDRFSSLPWSM
jgi:hypothetical protein